MAKRSRNKKASEQTALASLPPRDWLLGSLLILAVALVYVPIWWAGFGWTDNTVLTANPVIVGPLGLKEIWATHAASNSPLTLTTFWFEHALWGANPLPYHLVNVLLHAASTVLLWRVLHTLAVPGAWLGALLWAVHPVQVESVAWIAQMKNVESGLFFLLSILFFTKALAQENAPKFWSKNDILCLVFAALAMTAKTSTAILPLVLVLCAWWVRRKIEWRDVTRTAPVLLLSIVAGLLSMRIQGHDLATVSGPDWFLIWPQRIALAGDAVWFYLGNLVVPFPLMTIYPRWQIDPQQATAYLSTFGAMIALVVLWLNRGSWALGWLFAYLSFLFALLPVLGFVMISYFELSFVADRFQYLAAMGPLALVGAGLSRFMDRRAPKAAWWKWIAGAVVPLALAILSWQRILLYQSPEALWADALRKNPESWAAYNNLGQIAVSEGQLDEATALYKKSLVVNPRYAPALFNLGVVQSQTNHPDDALDNFKKAVDANPNFVEARYNYANSLFQKGHVDEAMDEYQEVLKQKPDHVLAHNNFGFALFQTNRMDAAKAQFQEAIRLDPNFAAAHYNLGLAYVLDRNLDGAIREFQETLRLEPSNTDAQKNLDHAQSIQRGM